MDYKREYDKLKAEHLVLSRQMELIKEAVSPKIYNLGDKFFKTTVKHLNEALQADSTFIGRLKGNTTIEQIAHYGDGIYKDNENYNLIDTPCDNVIGSKVCIYSEQVHKTFPKDTALSKLGIEGYIGVPLFDSAQKGNGILVSIFKRPIPDPALAEAILLVFASQAGAELEHQKIYNELKESDLNLSEQNKKYIQLNKELDQQNRELQATEEELNQTNEQLYLSHNYLEKTKILLQKSQEMASVGSWELDLPTNTLIWSDEVYRIFGIDSTEYDANYESFLSFIHPEDRIEVDRAFSDSINQGSDGYEIEHRIIRKDSGEIRYVHEKCKHIKGDSDEIMRSVGMVQDITQRKRIEEALEKRILGLTLPMNEVGDLFFEELFQLDEIQRLQDEFSEATGVASVITHPDGTPITKPSNFCRLCSDIIRKTDRGLRCCYKSDATLGRFNPAGPIVQKCMSGGLWDAGASIQAGGKHIANWLIGQVRDEMQTDTEIKAYAREISVDEKEFVDAYNEVPAMSLEQFERISMVLHTMSKILSVSAYQNIQQARFIAERKENEEKIIKNKDQLQLIFDISPVIMLLLNNDSEIVKINKTGLEFVGGTIEEIDQNQRSGDFNCLFALLSPSGCTYGDHCSDCGVYKTIFDTIKNRKSHHKVETTLTFKRNHIEEDFTVLVSSVVVTEKPDPTFLITIDDITAIKKSELALVESERKFKSLVDSTRLITWEVEFAALSFTYMSPTIKQLSGYSAEEWKDFDFWSKVIHPDDREYAVNYCTSNTQNGIDHEFEYRIITKQGEVKWVKDFVFIVKENGKTFLRGFFSDNTERKMAQLKLHESEKKYKTIIESANDAIFIADAKTGIIEDVNKKAENLTGKKREELIGLHQKQLHPNDESAFNASIFKEDVDLAHELIIRESNLLHANGEKIPVEINPTKFDLENGKQYLVGFFRDIRERKLAEKELSESEQKFRTVVTASDAITWMMDKDGVFTLSEGKGLADLGLSPGEIIGQNAFELYKDYPDMISGLTEAYNGKTNYKTVRFGGMYFQTIYTPFMTPESSEVVGIVGIALNVTEKLVAEEELKMQKEELISMKQKVAEYKLAALRSAMNPHFIFNCLNSIQMYVAKNDRKPALKYLSLFSKLIRSVLQSSMNSHISLEKEIEVLKYYIELEQVRFSDKFEVSLSVGEEVDKEGTEVPSLFLQPYIENAIIHGLSNKPSTGILSIVLDQKDNLLICIIEDDGIGRVASQNMNENKKRGHKSVGMSVTEERLNIINRNNSLSVIIDDLYTAKNEPCGTRVKIKLQIK